MTLKDSIDEYTRKEFLDFIGEIDRANEDEPDSVLSPLLMHFRKITEHPSGIDLLYRPATAEDGKPERIVEIVESWRLANGKSGFKS